MGMKYADNKCRTCKYHGWMVNFGAYCEYMGITGFMRDCDTKDCEKYEKGKSIKTLSARWTGMSNNSTEVKYDGIGT